MPVRVTFAGSGDAFGSGGRFQTCILVDGNNTRFAIDFGASSLIAINALDIPHNSIDVILLTHIHGDHAGGIPFLLLDAMLGAKRDRPLTIAGPRNLKERLDAMALALFPGMETMTPKFPVDYIELPLEQPTRVRDLSVTPFSAKHTWQTDPTALRVDVDGRVVTYSGDGDWTPGLARASEGADLFIAECYFRTKPVKWHLNYPAFLEHKADFNAKRIVLTHMGPEMLAATDELPEECAHDGLVIEL